MFKSILAAVAVVMTIGSAATATDWQSWDTSGEAAELTQKYLHNNNAYKWDLGTDTDIVALAEEVAYKERNLLINTHSGAENFDDLAQNYEGSWTVEPGLSLNYRYTTFDGEVYVGASLYSNYYVNAEDRLTSFFEARSANLDLIQQYHLDNNDSYTNGGVDWTNF